MKTKYLKPFSEISYFVGDNICGLPEINPGKDNYSSGTQQHVLTSSGS